MIQQQQNRSSSNTFASFYQEQSILQARVQVQQVWLPQFVKILIQVSIALRLEHLCWLISEFAALTNLTKWIWKIKPQFTKLWSSRLFQSLRLEFMQRLTQELLSWQQLTLFTADTIVRSHSDTTLIFHLQLCLVSICSSSFLMKRTMKKTSKLLSTLSACIVWETIVYLKSTPRSNFRPTLKSHDSCVPSSKLNQPDF